MTVDFKGSHFDVAYPVSYRQFEETMQEQGVDIDHATLNRWVLKCVPLLETAFCKRRSLLDSIWRMDET